MICTLFYYNDYFWSEATPKSVQGLLQKSLFVDLESLLRTHGASMEIRPVLAACEANTLTVLSLQAPVNSWLPTLKPENWL